MHRPLVKLVKSAYTKIIILFLNQSICCGYSKEPSQLDGSFEHPKYMLQLMGKKLLTMLHSFFVFLSKHMMHLYFSDIYC